MRYVADLAAEVDVTPDATLSKVLVREGPVRVVLFAFDRDQELTEHTAAVPAVIEVISGVLVVTTGGDEHRMAPGSWLLLEAHEPHTVRAEEPSKMLLTMIRCPDA